MKKNKKKFDFVLQEVLIFHVKFLFLHLKKHDMNFMNLSKKQHNLFFVEKRLEVKRKKQ
jgi:hypothetical protein